MDSLTQIERAYPDASCSTHLTRYDHGGEKFTAYFIHVHMPTGLLKFQGKTIDEAVDKAIKHPFAKPDALQKALEEIYERTEAHADGAPDANQHDHLCNWISGRLAPFIPTEKR